MKKIGLRARSDFCSIPCSESTSQYIKRHFNNPNKQPMSCEDSEWAPGPRQEVPQMR